MGRTVFCTVLVCGFIIAETAKLQGHIHSSGRHSDRVSSDHLSDQQPHSSRKVPEQISIRLLTSALKNVLSSQDDFVVSDQSLSSSTEFSDSSQDLLDNQFKDLTDKSAFPELQLTLPDRDLFWQTELQDSGSFGTSEKSTFVENVPNGGQETSLADQDFFGSNLETSQTVGQSGTESFDSSFTDQQFIVSQVESTQHGHSNQQPSFISFNDNHFSVSSLDSSKAFSHSDSESFATSSPNLHLTISHLESSKQQDHVDSDSFVISSPDQQFTVSFSESATETGNTPPESFVVSPQGHTDSESFSTSFSDHQFLDSHIGSQQQSHLDSELFAPLSGDQQFISTQFEPPRDFGDLNSESLAPLSLDQRLEVPRSESSQGFGLGNSIPDKEFHFSLSGTSEHLTQPKIDSFTAPFPDQQFVVPNAEPLDQSGHSESDPFGNGGLSFLSDSPGHLSSSSGLAIESSPSIPFIDSHTPESKSFNVHDHSSIGSQIKNVDEGIHKSDGQFGHPKVEESSGQFIPTNFAQSPFNTNFFVDGSHMNTPPGGTTDTPSNQDFNQHSPILDEFDQTNEGCPGDQIRHVDGRCVTPEISRRLFVIDVPTLEAGVPSKQEVPPPKVEENIVFIRTPEAFSGRDPIIAPPPQRRDTIFIVKESPQGQDRRVIEVETSPPQRPNVYFLNYEDGQRPTLPDGLDLETALQSAIRIEGKVIDASKEGKVTTGFTSNSDTLLTHNRDMHTHGVASETSIPEHDVRRHGVNDFINPVPDFLSTGNSDLITTVNNAHSTKGNINFSSNAALR
ncbi:uncharacterized protein [Macrobrachium rosenbergii]|uniref:uncharacterized protein n=1 Tax=Macrobrachium rosenbergii TaxID=79674 RepID=UPI0034D41910